ncbi:MAG TPA: OB-fold domain-containing protein [Steroidobacteraceae bacterium]
MTEISRVAHPTLYGPTTEGGVTLFGLRCRRCAKVGFPRQRYGCENCGAYGDDLLDLDLAPEGELVSFAAVHRHQGRDIQAPFVMAEVRLDSGPLLRCTLAQRDDAGLAIGKRVIGRLVDGTSPDAPRELRFFVAGA